MSRNKEIKFAKWWEENILDEYREIKEKNREAAQN